MRQPDKHAKKVEGLLIDCAAAGRVFGAPIGLPDWNKVLAMPGHQFAHSLDEELKEEMERVTNTINWNSLETPLDRTNNDELLLIDIVDKLDEWVRSRPAPKRTLRHNGLRLKLNMPVVTSDEAGLSGRKGRTDPSQ